MSKEDLQKLEALTAKVETLEKSQGETLEKLAKAEAENVALKAEVEVIKATTPAPGGPVLRVVGKSGDVQELSKEAAMAETEEKLIKEGDTVGLIKMAHTAPRRFGAY